LAYSRPCSLITYPVSRKLFSDLSSVCFDPLQSLARSLGWRDAEADRPRMIWVALLLGVAALYLIWLIYQKVGWINRQLATVIRHLERINGDEE
jgi:hypothetical protein